MDGIHSWNRSAACVALLVGLLVAPQAGAETGIAASGPCAVAADRDPCAGGSCSRHGAKVRGRFSPASVASDAGGDSGEAPPPPSFVGPGSCVDPSTGCGEPTVVSLRRSEIADPGPQPEPFIPPVAPLPNQTPAPPTPPAPNLAGGPPAPPTPPTPNPSIDPPAPATPPAAPPAPPSAPPPPATPPGVVEPPPGPVLPPGVPQP